MQELGNLLRIPESPEIQKNPENWRIRNPEDWTRPVEGEGVRLRKEKGKREQSPTPARPEGARKREQSPTPSEPGLHRPARLATKDLGVRGKGTLLR